MLTITEPTCECTRIAVDTYDVSGCPLCDPHSEYNLMQVTELLDEQEPPEWAFHKLCAGEGCADCAYSGVDPVIMRELAEMERQRDEARYDAYLESRAA